MLEIIAETIEDARIIEKGGGERIELVSSLSEGGLTPSYGMVKNILLEVSIPVNVMIRPHSKSFNYSKEDIRVMKEDARIFQELGVKHVVLGMLDNEGLPDVAAMDEVLKDTTFNVTYHRAIDESSDVMKSLEILEDYNRVTHILTSGGPGKAMGNLEVLKEMVKASKRLTIIAASGLSHENLSAIESELEFEKERINGELLFDPNVGTAVRGGSVKSPVKIEEVKSLVDIYRHNGKKEKW
ncbi:MAG: copper homeostasis protein CutC [Clostridium sp.]|nr:copper homeostasis protein CutC [Clostridium sp.]